MTIIFVSGNVLDPKAPRWSSIATILAWSFNVMKYRWPAQVPPIL